MLTDEKSEEEEPPTSLVWMHDQWWFDEIDLQDEEFWEWWEISEEG